MIVPPQGHRRKVILGPGACQDCGQWMYYLKRLGWSEWNGRAWQRHICPAKPRTTDDMDVLRKRVRAANIERMRAT